MAASRSPSAVARNTPWMDEASDPTTMYRIRSASRAQINSLSAFSSSGSIIWKFVAVDFAEQIRAESLARLPQEDFAFAGLGILLAQPPFRQTPHELRVLERAPQFLRGRHPPLQIQKDLPRFGRCIGGAHTLTCSLHDRRRRRGFVG